MGIFNLLKLEGAIFTYGLPEGTQRIRVASTTIISVNVDPSVSQRAIYYRREEQDPVDVYENKSLRPG